MLQCGPACLWTRSAQLQRRSSHASANGNVQKRSEPLETKYAGRNLATACLTLVQHLFLKRRGSSHWPAAQIHTPSMALPRANWRTIHSRKARWQLWRGSQLGDNWRIGHGADMLQNRLQAVPVIMKLSTNDAAMTNACIVCQEEEEFLQGNVAHEKFRLHLHTHCLGHQAALLCRPAARSCGDLATIIVRLGHVLSTSRQMAKFLESMDLEIEGHFEYVPAFRLPDETPDFRRKSAWYMRASQSAYDLSDEFCGQVLDFFNSDWRGTKIKHICIAGRCRFACDGPEDSLMKAKTFARGAFSHGLVIGLEYRWKGMERAAGWCLRARALHELGPRSLRRMYTSKSLEEAEAIAEQASQLGDLGFATRNALKASSVLRHFAADPGNRYLVRLHFLTHPIQQFLNEIQEVDGVLCTFTTACTARPECPSTAETMLKMLRKNLRFISGYNGRKLARAYFRLLQNFSDPLWDIWEDEPQELKLELSLMMCRSMGESWFRTVFYVGDRRFTLITDVVGDPEAAHMDEEQVKFCIASLTEEHAKCRRCLDNFCEVMLDLLTTNKRLGYDTCRSALCLLRVGSAIVERAHLPGEELHHNKARGVAPAAQRLGEETYRRSVIHEPKGVSDIVHAEVFKNRGLNKRSYSKLSASFRLGGFVRRAPVGETGPQRRKRLSRVKQRLKPEAARRRKADAFRSFRSQRWECRAQVGTPAFKAEEARIKGLWAALNEDERAFYEGAADARQQALNDASGDLTMDSLTKDHAHAIGGAATQRLKSAVYLEAVRDVLRHDAWERGVQLMGMSSGLRASAVDATSTDAEVSAHSARYFGYDPQVLPNPVGAKQPRRTCYSSTYGRCLADPHLGAAKILVYNTYMLLQRWKKPRSDFPLHLRWDIANQSEDMLLCETVGKRGHNHCLALATRG